MVGETVRPTYFRPGTLHVDDGETYPLPRSNPEQEEEWILVDGTPASCVQIGLYHFFQHRGPVDLVVSGPNYGRNTTSIFSLSSGTIGGAMEAATCGTKAIALSYAFNSREHDPIVIGAASKHSVRIIEHLYKNWGNGVDVYSINIPLVKGVEENKVLYTEMLQNQWSGSAFQEMDPEGVVDGEEPDAREREIREEMDGEGKMKEKTGSKNKYRHFKWAPRFTDVHKSVDESLTMNDGKAVREGMTR